MSDTTTDPALYAGAINMDEYRAAKAKRTAEMSPAEYAQAKRDLIAASARDLQRAVDAREVARAVAGPVGRPAFRTH